METTIFSVTDEKGREFKLTGDLGEIQKEIALLHSGEYEEEYGVADVKSTEEDRFAELVEVSAFFDENYDWTEIINDLPKKKNGTFAKGRVKTIHRANSFAQEWEDSYGYGAPEIRIKVLSDLEAYVQFGWYVEKW